MPLYMQIILGGCLLCAPFLIPAGVFRKIVNAALPAHYQNRYARLIVMVFLCVPTLTLGLYFLLNPVIPGSCDINIKAFDSGYTSQPLRPVHLQLAPLGKEGEPDFSRVQEGSFSLSGSFQKEISFDWFENKLLVRVYDVSSLESIYFEKVISISPFARAGITPASYSLDMDYELEENPFRVTKLLVGALLSGIAVLLIFFYRDGKKKDASPLMKPYFDREIF